MANEIQKKPVIAQYLEKFKDQIQVALPRHMTADRMSRIVLTEVRKVPALLKCNPASLFGAVVQASQLGLEPGNALGQCYLIPFKNDVNLIIGYKGMIDLARRSGQIISIEARAVYEADEFSFSFGLNPDLNHTPFSGDVSERGNPTHFYAVAKIKGGGLQWDVMSKSEVDLIMNQSKASKFGPWKTHYDEMGKKTVIRRLFKYLPVSIEMQSAIGLDELHDSNQSQQNSSLIDGDFMVIDDDTNQNTESSVDSIKSKLSETIDTQTGEVKNNHPDADTVIKIIKNAETSIDLDVACDMIRYLPKKDQGQARHEAISKREQLEVVK